MTKILSFLWDYYSLQTSNGYLLANSLNDFIQDASLVDVPFEGRAFTWVDIVGFKMSKIDRFLISGDLIDVFTNISSIVLDRKMVG